MKIKLSCSMCSKEKTLALDSDQRYGQMKLSDVVELAGWIWQQNGPHADIYCSKKCAE